MSTRTWAGVVAGGMMLAAVAMMPVAHAQQAAPKIGYVDLGQVFDGYQRTKESEQVLEQKGKQTQGALEGRFGELKKMRETLELMNDQAREAKAKELEEKSDEFQRLKTKTERELLRDRNQAAKDILEEIDRGVTEFAKANGYFALLDRRSLLYGEPGADVTGAVLKMLNDRYAAKSTAAKKPTQ